MGLFGKKDICCICKANPGSKRIADGYVCKECVERVGVYDFYFEWKNTSKQTVEKAIECQKEYEQLSKIFNPTKTVLDCFFLDEVNKLWRANTRQAIFHCDDIIRYDFLENGEVISSEAFGGIKTQMEVKQMDIKVVIKHPIFTDIYIKVLFSAKTKVKSGTMMYYDYLRNAQKVISLLDIITSSRKSQNSSEGSSADDILKYKQLLDMGAITQEEYDAKKKQLLGL